MIRSWRLQGPGETCIIAPRSMVSQEEQAAYLSAQLDRWLADPLTRKTVLEIYESIRGHSTLLANRLQGQELHKYVKSEILQAFRRGEFVLMRTPHLTVFPTLILPQKQEEAAPAEGPPPPVQEKREAEQKTWVGFELSDQDGNPVPNVRYELELPGGKKRSGSLDQNGQLLVKDIDPGSAIISFPDLDGRELEAPTGTPAPVEATAAAAPGNDAQTPSDAAPVSSASAASPATQPAVEQAGTFLNVHLLKRGKIRSGITYALAIDGSTLKGTTDSNGTVHQPAAESVTEARLTLDSSPVTEEYGLTVGALPPIDDLAGGQARLANLGFRTGPADGKMGSRTHNALRNFQSRHGLDVTGEYDEATRNKLKEIHDQAAAAAPESAAGAEDSELKDDIRYGVDFPTDPSSSVSTEAASAGGNGARLEPKGTLLFSRTVSLTPPGVELFNAFDHLPPPAMLEIEDASYHHKSCVTLPALPTFGRPPKLAEQRGEEGEFTKAVAKSHPLVHNDFWNRRPEGLPAEEQLWDRSGLVYVAVVYLFLKHNPSYRLLLAGHTDTSGQDEYNFELGDLRAHNFLHLLRGEREKWVENSNCRFTTEDVQRIVKYFARRRGWGCDPGEVNGEDSEETTEAVRCFQSHFNSDFSASIQTDGKFGKETWGAVFDLYMAELARLLETTVDGLESFRGQLQFAFDDHPTITCGERIPIDEPQRDNFRSATNRRVEVLFFHPSDTPDLTAHLPGGKIRSGTAHREASDIYSPESPKFVLIDPKWWEHPASPVPFNPQFRIEELGEEDSDEIESEVPIGVVDRVKEEDDPWTFLDPFKEFDPGSSGKDDFQQLVGSEDRANV